VISTNKKEANGFDHWLLFSYLVCLASHIKKAEIPMICIVSKKGAQDQNDNNGFGTSLSEKKNRWHNSAQDAHNAGNA
jgi:hypothetical protein